MTLEGYTAKIEYDDELELFRGVILDLSGYADFFGSSPKSLKKEFKKSLEIYLESCKEEGVEPKKCYSGKFNVTTRN
jgi:predicted HicB family RNase H-like nuclease